MRYSMDFQDFQRVGLGLYCSGDVVTGGAFDVVRHDFRSAALNYSVHAACSVNTQLDTAGGVSTTSKCCACTVGLCNLRVRCVVLGAEISDSGYSIGVSSECLATSSQMTHPPTL